MRTRGQQRRPPPSDLVNLPDGPGRAEGPLSVVASAPPAQAPAVPTRLAAAAANPQLPKLLDPNSGLTDNYTLQGVLGKGSYGEVRLAVHKMTERFAAVKRIARSKLTDAKLRRRVEAEVEIHRRLHHPHVARLFEVIRSPQAISLCMQYAPRGTMRDLLDEHGALPEPRARHYARQLLGALHYCHHVVEIVHRDLKLDNLLLDDADNLLLADFGFAASVANSPRLRLLCGSPHYSAPEIFAQKEYVGTQADMWSLGVLLYTMLAGHFPFQADTMEALGRKVMRGKWDRPLAASAPACALAKRILVLKGSERARLDSVCSDAWVLDGAAVAADVIPFRARGGGRGSVPWDANVATHLDAMGCPANLVKHHVTTGTQNHVSAAYEVLLLTGGGTTRPRMHSAPSSPAA